MEVMAKVFPDFFSGLPDVQSMFTHEAYVELMDNKFAGNFSQMAAHSEFCDYHKIITEVKHY